MTQRQNSMFCVDIPSSATENKSSQCRLHMRPWRTHRPSTSRIVDMSVMTKRHVPVTMQLQAPAMKRAQSTMSSTQVQHIDKEVDVPVAMRDRLTGEESEHAHLADSLRGTVRTSNEVMMEPLGKSSVSCQCGERCRIQKQTQRGTGWCSRELSDRKCRTA